MPVTLRPRNYKQGLSWNMMPKYKIDTVTFKPYINNLLSPEVVHNEEITSVTINNQTYALPITDAITPNATGSAYNSDGDLRLASGQVQVVTVSGSFTLQVTNPLPAPPTAILVFEGDTKYVNRGSLGFTAMENLFWGNSNIAPTINSNSDGTESWTDSKSSDSYNRGLLTDPTLVDYTRPTVPLFPFVRVVRAAGSGATGYQQNRLTEEEVLTHWISGVSSGVSAVTPYWSDVNNPNAWLSWDSRVYPLSSTELYNFQRAAFANRTVPITTEVVKVNDYEYTINWSAPIRYAYHGESQDYQNNTIDSYAFVDRISKITVQIVAREMNTDTVDVSYGLIDNTLTTEVMNNYPISFGANEFITLDTYDASQIDDWTRSLSRLILQKYENGKYVIECEVYIDWAIANNITVNTQLYIALQDGTIISRNGTDILFEVKTIEKSFKASEFTYILRLLEV